MVDLWTTRKTAFLKVSAQQINTSISFLDGVPVWATGGGKSEALGRLCVTLGLIDDAQYERAILRLAELDEQQQQQARLGDVLIELGFLDSTQLQRALRTQIREKIIACFQWSQAEFEVEVDSTEIRQGNIAPWPVPALIAEGIVRHYDISRCDKILAPQLARRVRLFDAPPTIAVLLNLPPDLLVPFAEEQTLEQATQKGLLQKQLGSALLLLGFFDVIGSEDLIDQLRLPSTMDLSFGTSGDLVLEEPEEDDLLGSIEAEHEKLRTSTPEVYFGLRPNATPTEVHTAFESRVRPFVQAGMAETTAHSQARLTEMYNAIAAVRDALLEKNRPKRPPARAASPELSAEAAFLRGKQSLERGDRKAAAQLFVQACEKSPETRVYQMYRAYTEMLQAATDWDRDKAFAETRKFAKETLEQDAKNGKAHLMLGRLLRLEGKEDRARQEFETAVEVANDKEAELELRVLQRRMAKKASEKEKRGLFFWKKP
jgi:tetratricopeptide (TPR) repeat protein